MLGELAKGTYDDDDDNNVHNASTNSTTTTVSPTRVPIAFDGTALRALETAAAYVCLFVFCFLYR